MAQGSPNYPQNLRDDRLSDRILNRTPTEPKEKKQITRNRTSYSCHTCRRRKIKCDKIHPVCTNCAKTGDECIYDSGSRLEQIQNPESSPEENRQGLKRRRETASGSNYSDNYNTPSSNGWGPQESNNNRNEAIESRLDRLTSLVEALSRRSDNHENNETDLPDAQSVDRRNSWARATERPNPQRLGSGYRPRYGSEPNSPSSGHDDSRRESNELADPTNRLNMGFLSLQDGGRSRYVGNTFWAFITDELDQLNQLLRDQSRYINGGNECSKSEDEEECGPPSIHSEDSFDHNSFHKQSNPTHHHESLPRKECPGCQRASFDKSVLFQAAEAHPSRYRKLHSDSLVDIPSKRQSHVLFRCWLAGVHVFCPLVYPPLVLEKYHKFWTWYEQEDKKGRPPPDPTFIPLLYGIWYAGSVSISVRGLRAEFPDISRATLSARLHDQVTRWLTIAGFPRSPSMPALIAFLMVQTILAREEEPFTSSQYISLAIRVAQVMGLHRDPSLFNFEPWEAEMRRRVWWHIVQMDVEVSCTSGQPPQVIDENYWDVNVSSELKDAKLGTPDGQEYQRQVLDGGRPRDSADEPLSRNRPSMVNATYVFFRGRCLAACGIRQLLRIQLGYKSVTKHDMKKMISIIEQVEADLNEIINRIPTKGIPEMGWTPDRNIENGGTLVADYDPSLSTPLSDADLQPFSGKTPTEGLNANSIKYHWNALASFHKASRIVLSLLINKIYCVTYQPFLKNAKSKIWPAARQCALHHCHSYMRKFISLATDPAFQPFHWSWPGSHQPMHAVMIMLVDLYERPHSAEAPISRAYIDKVFLISAPDGGIVSGEDGMTVQRPLREGGREAWDMLKRLREKAWQRAGLDPDVLWTEEDQINVGVGQAQTETQKMLQTFRDGSIYEKPRQPSDGSNTPRQSVSQAVNAFINDSFAQPQEPKNPPPRESTLSPRQTDPKQERLPQPPTQIPTPGFSVAPAPPPPQPRSYNASSTTDSLPFGFAPARSQPVSAMPPAASIPNQVTTASPFNPAPTPASITSTTTNNPAVSETYQAPSSVPAPDQSTMCEHFDWDQWDAVFGKSVPMDDMEGLDLENRENDTEMHG